jgi:hypothetical protein
MMKAEKAKYVLLIAGFALVIYGVPVTDAVINVRQGGSPAVAEIFTQPPTTGNLRAVEKGIEQESWFAKTIRPWAQWLQFTTFRDCGDKGLAGNDGWFFYTPAVQSLVEAAPEADDVVSAIVDYRDKLAERGIKLLVMCAPNKASVYPEKLTSRAGGINYAVNPHTLEILSQLRSANVEVLNLFEAFGGAKGMQTLYLAQDSHWTSAGAQLAAKKAAEKLIELGWVEKGQSRFKYRPLLLSRIGDVLQMMRIPDNGIQPEGMNCTQVLNADTGALYMDDPNSDVLVMGDSFLRIYERDEPGSAGLISQLAYELSKPVASLVNDGGASTLVRQQLYHKPALLKGKKVVVWEFVERDIRFGTEGWQKVPVPAAE